MLQRTEAVSLELGQRPPSPRPRSLSPRPPGEGESQSVLRAARRLVRFGSLEKQFSKSHSARIRGPGVFDRCCELKSALRGRYVRALPRQPTRKVFTRIRFPFRCAAAPPPHSRSGPGKKAVEYTRTPNASRGSRNNDLVVPPANHCSCGRPLQPPAERRLRKPHSGGVSCGWRLLEEQPEKAVWRRVDGSQE